MGLAGHLLENGPIVLQQAKLAIDQVCGTDLATGSLLDTAAYKATIATRDSQEGFTAFHEQHQPVYTGE
jgi:enoyl-CoA hydratase/carnithine racemase